MNSVRSANMADQLFCRWFCCRQSHISYFSTAAWYWIVIKRRRRGSTSLFPFSKLNHDNSSSYLGGSIITSIGKESPILSNSTKGFASLVLCIQPLVAQKKWKSKYCSACFSMTHGKCNSSLSKEGVGVAMPSLIVHTSLWSGLYWRVSRFLCCKSLLCWISDLTGSLKEFFYFQRLGFLPGGSFSPSRRFPPPIKEIFFKENEDSSNQLAYFLL